MSFPALKICEEIVKLLLINRIYRNQFQLRSMFAKKCLFITLMRTRLRMQRTIVGAMGTSLVNLLACGKMVIGE